MREGTRDRERKIWERERKGGERERGERDYWSRESSRNRGRERKMMEEVTRGAMDLRLEKERKCGMETEIMGSHVFQFDFLSIEKIEGIWAIWCL